MRNLMYRIMNNWISTRNKERKRSNFRYDHEKSRSKDKYISQLHLPMMTMMQGMKVSKREREE